MRASIDPAIVAARHPKEAAIILGKIGALSAAEVAWNYDACLRIEGDKEVYDPARLSRIGVSW